MAKFMYYISNWMYKSRKPRGEGKGTGELHEAASRTTDYRMRSPLGRNPKLINDIEMKREIREATKNGYDE